MFQSDNKSREKLRLVLAEIQARGLAIPDEFRDELIGIKNVVNFPMNKWGCFNNREGKPFIPNDKQAAFISNEARFSALISGRGGGKALEITTPIITTDGWKELLDIHAGDYVYSPSGNPVLVLSESSIAIGHKCYEVSFSDGSVIVADEEHLWKVREWKSSINCYDRIMTTKEMMLSKLKSHDNYVYSVPVTKALEFSEKEFLLHPYLLGVWLGDGSSRDAKLCIHDTDTEIIDKISVLGYEVHKLSEYCAWSLGDVLGKVKVLGRLRAVGVLKNKHIPSEYLFGSKEQRLHLLKGLMDTDGTVNTRGNCSFDNTNLRLVEDVYKLVCSLGIKATLRPFYVTYKGEKSLYYKVAFTPQETVFTLKRKRDRQKLIHRPDITRRSIVSIEEVPTVPVKCIKVDADDGLFLAGYSLIPTHNTASGAQKALAKIAGGASGAVLNPDF